MFKTSLSAGVTLGLALVATAVPMKSEACGGFFCTTIPINQAAEQIVFRQEPGMVTAMVRIVYTGAAEDFSWVVPVPDTPALSVGSDTTFAELDFATQPNFNLRIDGNVCAADQDIIVATAVPSEAATDSAADGESGVVIEQEQEVGPFDSQVISSDNPDDMAIWLADNGYDIGDRGAELLAPYVNDGMKFVALKLRSGQSSGNIQPLIMRYASERPMVPIRLTAVAATDDMGVLVYAVNDQLGRAIPDNYLHVVPNYTKLDWFNGPFNAFGSYQNLITDAMDEAGGQGFATDFAGTITSDISSFFTDPADIETALNQLNQISDDAGYLSNSLFVTTNSQGALDALQAALPLPDGLTQDLYFSPERLVSVYTAEQLAAARVAMNDYLVTTEVAPLRDSTALIPEGAYLTRLFTTLSADEMTVDPTFDYNTTMPDQPRNREATVNASCTNDVSNWTLTLGAGTGRDGEVVLDVTGEPIPGFGIGIPTPIDDQPAAFSQQRTSADAEPEILVQAMFSPMSIDADGTVEGGLLNTVSVDPTDTTDPVDPVDPTGDVDAGGNDSTIADTESGSSSSGFFGSAGPGMLMFLTLLVFLRRQTSKVRVRKPIA